jgi:hypothetical protein
MEISVSECEIGALSWGAKSRSASCASSRRNPPHETAIYWEHRLWAPAHPWRPPPRPWVRLGPLGASPGAGGGGGVGCLLCYAHCGPPGRPTGRGPVFTKPRQEWYGGSLGSLGGDLLLLAQAATASCCQRDWLAITAANLRQTRPVCSPDESRSRRYSPRTSRGMPEPPSTKDCHDGRREEGGPDAT